LLEDAEDIGDEKSRKRKGDVNPSDGKIFLTQKP
jgi:hypothetical protein